MEITIKNSDLISGNSDSNLDQSDGTFLAKEELKISFCDENQNFSWFDANLKHSPIIKTIVVEVCFDGVIRFYSFDRVENVNSIYKTIILSDSQSNTIYGYYYKELDRINFYFNWSEKPISAIISYEFPRE